MRAFDPILQVVPAGRGALLHPGAGAAIQLGGTRERRTLDLNLLATAAALLETGGVSKAAIALGTSQPTVSANLSKLREYFEDPLFVRCAGGMAPTPRGAEVASAARDLLAEAERRLRVDPGFDPARSHQAFTVALSDVGEMVFLPSLLRHLARVAPNTPLRAVSMRPGALRDAMTTGDIDLAIGYFPDLAGSQFYQQLLLAHHFVCLLREGHPVQGHRLTLGEFLGLQHVVVHSEGRSQEILDRHLDAQALVRRVAVYTQHYLCVPRLIASSDLVVTVPHAVAMQYAGRHSGLKIMELPFVSPRIELRQHWHERVQKDARNVWLRRLVRDAFPPGVDEWAASCGAAHAPAQGL